MEPSWHPFTAVSGIYCIRCKIDGRCYIGQSSDVWARLAAHRVALMRGQHPCREMQLSWQKFGATAFEISILELVPGNQYCREKREKHWIAKFNAMAPRGFNGKRGKNKRQRIFATTSDSKKIMLGFARGLKSDRNNNKIKEWEE